jgi:hypothetical protein
MASDQVLPVLVRLSAEQVKALDAWRREQEDLPGRPEAIRRLMLQSLQAPPPKRKAR